MNETVIESIKTVNDTMKEAIDFIKASFKDVVLDASGIIQSNIQDLKEITSLKYTVSLYATPEANNKSLWTYTLFINDQAYTDKEFEKIHKSLGEEKYNQAKKEIEFLLKNAMDATKALQKMIYLKKGNTLVYISDKEKKFI